MTPQTAPAAAVKRTLRVGVPIDRAFRALTENMGTWWPASHHIGKAPFAEIVVEPRVSGRWFERDGSGKECDWGRVLVWNPPKQIVLSWQLQPDWQYSADMSRASEVSFEFIGEGPEMTRLEFEHRHIERHGEGWENLRKGVDSPGGWTGVLAQYECSLTGKNGAQTLSPEEREYAIAELESSHAEFLDVTRGLTPAQWNFKPAPDRWSAAECSEHIGVIEELAFQRITGKALKEPADPTKRKTIRFSDPGILRAGSERVQKLQAPESVQPSGRWETPDEMLQNLLVLRARTIEFVKTTQEDLRNHFLDHPAFQTLDAYQWVLLISGHMRRHTGQILEVKADLKFPKA